uniref:Scotophobin n=1 Tax=Rattus norvegicus TaxID=10116 RepID=SCOTP_RAT|nr:RecName: Full=Scotophobin [Rattus norvegicus]prf//721151A scotophobin [Rattus norvegicus]
SDNNQQGKSAQQGGY